MPKIKTTFKLTEKQFFNIWVANVKKQLIPVYEKYTEDCLIAGESAFNFEEFSAMMYTKGGNLISENMN